MNDKETSFWAGVIVAVGALAGFPLLVLALSCLNGWVLTKMWAWFIVPQFNLPSLTLWPAIGLSMTVSHLTFRQTNKDTRKFSETVITALAMPFMTLGFAALIHWIGAQR